MVSVGVMLTLAYCVKKYYKFFNGKGTTKQFLLSHPAKAKQY